MGTGAKRAELAAWALLAVVSLATFLVQTLGPGWLENGQGKFLVHDFLMQWAAGIRATAGQAALVYDWDLHSTFQAALVGEAKPVELRFMYPPHFLFFVLPFAGLDYVAATVAFLVASFALYVLALRPLAGSWGTALLAALAGGGTYYTFLWCQNGLLTAALLVGGLALLPRRPVLAGLCFGLLTIKPQFGLLLPLVLLIDRQWKAIAAAAITTILLAVLAELAFGPGIWKAALASLSRSDELLVSDKLRFKFQSVYALARLFLSPGAATAVHAAVGLLIAGLVGWIWSRRSGAYAPKAAALIAGTLLLSPYLFVYDSVALGAAVLFLLSARPALAEKGAMFGSLLLPFLSTRLLYSAAVPLAAMIVLWLAIRLAERGHTRPS
ncbi:glycosyltransferase family 87 protein [Sphingomonas astaxanthinifaciens]|uniref:DUF2029 domain-containing protein n=1 Tax=Sphingomonas astaxanthinifaciens DSM 22298 TaxID=1123267 RepID=A0ABQ5Z4T9_9SPHN|nr:glycosyltransferase family 87 protein [Sphingomonas astaxanthinifaciens]GLR47010.1 hypothetical protein GCM10007925_07210 [Sphingomonas astaxanthinifaciens DSM 22298]